MKLTKKITTLATVAGLTLASGSATAAITVVGQVLNQARSNNFDTILDASGADKLVVVVTGQHGFNNNAGKVNSLTYDGVDLIPASYRTAVTANTDTLYHGIFYLDNPSTSTGIINLQSENRGHVSAFLLTGTAAGHGASAMSANNTRTVDLTTTQANSMVFASQGLGGAGNFGATGSITADGDLTIIAAQSDPSNWTGHVVATQTIATPGTNTFSFTGGNVTGGMVAAAEFLEAAPIPEPSSAFLGLAGLALILRRRK